LSVNLTVRVLNFSALLFEFSRQEFYLQLICVQ